MEQIAKIGSSLLITGLVARYLGPERFGSLNYAAGIVALFAPIAGLGLTDILAKRSIAEPDKEPVVLATAFWLRLAGGAAMMTSIASVVILLFSKEAWSWSLLTASGTLILGAFGIYDVYFQVRLRHGDVVRWRLGALLGGVVVRLVLLVAKAPLEAFAAALVADAALIAAANLWAGRKGSRRSMLVGFDREEAITLLGASWPLISSGLLIALYFRIEQFIVMGMLGGLSYGVYMAASRIVNTANLVLPPILSSVFPLMARGSVADGNCAEERGYVSPEFQRALRLSGPGSIIIGATVAVAGVLMLYLVLGMAYEGAAAPLLILCLGVPAIGRGGVRAQFFMIQGLNHLHNYAALCGLAVNAGLALLLTPRFGIAGAAIATTVGAYVSACGTSLLFAQTRHFGVLQFRSFFAWGRFADELRRLY